MSTGIPPVHTAYSQPYRPTSAPMVNSMTRIKQELGPGLLNASRIPIDVKQLYGLQEGEPVPKQGGKLIPQTGTPKLDQLAYKVEDVVMFAPQALGHAVTESVRGSLTGGIVSAVVTALGGGLVKAVARESQFSLGGWVAGLTAIGTLMGGGLSFAHAMYQNLLDLKQLLFGVKTKIEN